MDPISHSRAAQVAYQDLLRMHLDEAASEVVGSIEERQRNGRTYAGSLDLVRMMVLRGSRGLFGAARDFLGDRPDALLGELDLR